MENNTEKKIIKGVEMIPCVLNGEYKIILPKHRADRPEWYTQKGWEAARLWSMYLNLGVNPEKPDTIFYIGSEEGEMPALCQMWGAKVLMFEPNDRVWPNTAAIWEANNLEAPFGTFSGFAANKTTKDAQLILGGFPASVTGPIIPDHGFKELDEPGNIQQVKIDDITFIQGFIPTALSLDVEGSEWEVLQGAEQTLRVHHPKIWLSLHPEFLFNKYQKYSYEVRRWLIDMGYKEELLDYQHEAHFYYSYEK